MQGLLIGFCNLDGMRLLRGTTWIFKYNLSGHVSFRKINNNNNNIY